MQHLKKFMFASYQEPYPIQHGPSPSDMSIARFRGHNPVESPQPLCKAHTNNVAMELNIRSPQNGVTDNGVDSQTDSASSSPENLVISSPPSDYLLDSPKNLTISLPSSSNDALTPAPTFEPSALSIPSQLDAAPVFISSATPTIMSNLMGTLTASALEMSADKKPRPPWKGVMVPCGQLKEYLDSLVTFNRKCMLRKGREVHKIYVDMVKGESFLDDQFSYTEFGKLVLTNGSIRAGRAKNAKQIVVARETLYCSGMAMCKRMCGGYGVCVPACDKTKMRGHRCAYRIKLTQRLGYVNFWFVEVLGTHDQLGSENTVIPDKTPIKDENGKKYQQLADTAMDLTSSVKSKKSKKGSPVANQTLDLSINSSPEKGNIPQTVAETYGVNGIEMANNYHYVLGLMPPSPSQNLSNNLPENAANLYSTQIASQRALEIYRAMAIQMAANAQAANPSHVTVVTPAIPEDSNTSNNVNNIVSPPLVSVKMEPQDDLQSDLQGQGHLYYPTPPAAHSSPASQSPSRKSHSHSPSPSRVQVHPQSPLAQGQGHTYQPTEGQTEVGQHKMQAQQEILGQVHNQIMERARSRKRGRTLPQKYTPSQDHEADITNSSQPYQASLNIPAILNTSNVCAINSNPTIDLVRFQTLNHILQSEAFQAARHQLESTWRIAKQSQDSALNLTQDTSNKPSPNTVKKSDDGNETQLNYLKLLDEWRRGGQLAELLPKTAPVTNGHQDLTKLTNLEELSEKEKELVSRVRQLESHVRQLQNIVIKSNSDDATKTGRKKAQREFDFTKYNTRHVALKVAYLGFDYQGFASVEDSERTIEHQLFEALRKTRLVEARETANYSRCGRTDKGVSAFGQVISIDLRTNMASGVGVKVRGGSEKAGEKTAEIRYPFLLNKVLPPEIRVLAWAPIDPGFNARFSCKRRTYKYIFPRGDLDLNEASTRLIGEHDFRNFCKMDVSGGVTNFLRRIVSVDLTVQDESESGYTMCEVTIVGWAFLWHQIRCIMAVLMLIAKGKEKPEIIDELFDIENTTRKPQYTMASEIPLVLFDSDYGDGFEWIYEADAHEENIKHLQEIWAQYSTKATMVKRMLKDLDKAKVETECDIAPWSDLSPPILHQASWIHLERAKKHKLLLERPRGETLEEKVEAVQAKRRRLDVQAAPAVHAEVETQDNNITQGEISIHDDNKGITEDKNVEAVDEVIEPVEMTVEEKALSKAAETGDKIVSADLEMDTATTAKE